MELAEIKQLAKKTFFGHQNCFLTYVSEIIKVNNLPDFVKNDFIKSVDYSTNGGKFVRGLSTVEAFLLFTPKYTDEALKDAAFVGWVIEYLQALFLILDDIMDSSDMRRGKPCLYKLADVGLSAINDAFLMQTSVFKLIKDVLSKHPKCLNILDLAMNTCVKTSLGESIDLKLCKYGQMRPPDFSLFTLECYESMVRFKTTYYTFVFPFIAGYLVSGRTDLEQFTLVFSDVLYDIGLIFQIQDDYLDVYGDSSVTGKVGTDIQEGKLTWLTAKILIILSHEDRVVFTNCYGSNDSHCIETIRKLYDKYETKKCYHTAIDGLIERTMNKIEQIAPPPFATYYQSYLNSIRERQK